MGDRYRSRFDRSATGELERPPPAIFSYQVLRLNEFVSNYIRLRGPSLHHCLFLHAIAAT